MRPSRAPVGDASSLSDEARKAFDAGRYGDAAFGFEQLRTFFPRSAEAREARLPLAECYLHQKDYDQALELYDEVLKSKPGDDVRRKVVGRKFEIGTAYVQGARRHLLLGIWVRAYSRGLRLLEEVRQQYPYEDFSDDALYTIAEYHFKKGNYVEAEEAYAQLVKEYPKSEWAGTSEHRIGLSVYYQIRAVGTPRAAEYDLELIREAREKLLRYIHRYPDGAELEDAKAKVRELEEYAARHELIAGRFYLGRGEIRAAELSLRAVALRYPETKAGREAAVLLEREIRAR